MLGSGRGVGPLAPPRGSGAPSTNKTANGGANGADRAPRLALVDRADPKMGLADLLESAARRGITQIWVSPAGQERLRLPVAEPPGPGHPFFAPPAGWRLRPSRNAGLAWIACQPERGPWVSLVIPAWDRNSPWHPTCFLNPGGWMIDQAAVIWRHLGVLWHIDGAYTSDQLLRHLHRRWPEPTVQPPPGLWPPDGGLPAGAEQPVSETRPLDGAERTARWCHHFDINGQHLAAASSLKIGHGEPVLETGPAFDKGAPGYWELDYGDGDTVWLTTPGAEWELRPDVEGRPPRIVRAWIWDRRSRFLESWYRTLRDARAALLDIPGYHDAGLPAAKQQPSLRAVKAIYRAGAGRLASQKRNRPDDPFYQPYAYWAIVAEARTRLLLNLTRLTQPPVAIDVDSAWWLTDEPSPQLFAQKIGLIVSSQVGKWKHEGTYPAETVRQALKATNPIGALENIDG